MPHDHTGHDDAHAHDHPGHEEHAGDGHAHAGHAHAGHGHGGHGHGGHGHSHAPPANPDAAFAIASGLNLAYALGQGVAGLLAGSMALVADAGHNLSDVLGLLLAWFAAWLSRRPPTRKHTYGYRRSSILAALANAVLLLIAVGAILVESVRRFWEPEAVSTGTVLWVAAIGVVINAGTALLFLKKQGEDLNQRGAYLHLMADAGVTVGVILAALVIRWTGWSWVDPAVSILIGVTIVVGTWGLLRDSVELAMDAVPRGVDRAGVERFLAGLPGVTEVHDLHIWALGTTSVALTAHLVRPDAALDDRFLDSTCRALQEGFGIAHSTIQLESGDPAHPCRLAPPGTV